MGATVGATLGRLGLLLGLVLGPVLGLLLTLAWPSPADAQGDGRSVVAQRYDADLGVQNGGDVAVRETLQMAFQGGPFTKGERRIPLDRLVGVSAVRVEQAAPQAVAYQSGQGRANTFSVRQIEDGGDAGSVLIEWWFPSTTNQSRTFVISYLAQGAVRFYDGGDQLYWDVTGNERPYPIQESTVSLRLPAGIAVQPQQWRTDLYPRRFLRDTAVTTEGVTWQASGMPSGETIEVRAQWPHGLISGSPPPWQQAADEQDRLAQTRAPFFAFAAGVGALAVALLGGLWLLITWYTRGRDPAVGKVPPELQDPPSDLPPALVGTVVDEHAHAHDVVAAVLDLAARGEIAIREVSNASLSGGRHDFELHLLQDRSTLDPRLRPHERLVLDSFFTRGPTVRLSELGGWWQYAVPKIEEALHQEAKSAGLFYDDPERIRRRYRRWGTMLALAGIVLAGVSCAAAPWYAAPIVWPFLVLAVVGLVLRFLAPRMPRRTAAGAIEAARWRAYARALQRQPVEQLRLPSSPPPPTNGAAAAGTGSDASPDSRAGKEPDEQAQRGAVFERTLPYAVALGQGKQWVERFAQAGTPTPRWLGPPVVVYPGPTWGGPSSRRYGRRGGWYPGYPGFPGYPGYPGFPPGQGSGDRNGSSGDRGGGGSGGSGGLEGWSESAAGGLERSSGSLADLIEAASDVLSRGGSGGWSGGGRGGGSWGGGSFGGGGGGGGSGGGGSGFS